MYAVIMAGGSGTRLWPMSRKRTPKQFQPLVTDKTLLEDTYQRMLRIAKPEDIYVATIQGYKDDILRLLPEISADHIFVDAEPKNTAPSIAVIAAYFAAKDPKAIVGTFASDHVVQNLQAFTDVIHAAEETIQKKPDYLTVVGIKPTFPDSTKGYIKIDGLFQNRKDIQIYHVQRFVEKPDIKTAEKFVKSWQYLWNASYFVWNAKTMTSWFKKFEPAIYSGARKIIAALGTSRELDVLREEYKKFPNTPIDIAIAERVKKILAIPADLGWSDIGTWDVLHNVLSEMTGHHMVVKGHHIGHADERSLIFAHDKMIATIGLKDVIIIDTPDALLIADKNRVNEMKELLDHLRNEGKHLYL